MCVDTVDVRRGTCVDVGDAYAGTHVDTETREGTWEHVCAGTQGCVDARDAGMRVRRDVGTRLRMWGHACAGRAGHPRVWARAHAPPRVCQACACSAGALPMEELLQQYAGAFADSDCDSPPGASSTRSGRGTRGCWGWGQGGWGPSLGGVRGAQGTGMGDGGVGGYPWVL